MARIEGERAFKPLNISVITVSDTRTKETDTSGDVLEKLIVEAGHKCLRREIIRDNIDLIMSAVEQRIEDPDTHVVITTGGTGLTGRDVTVEAVRPLFDKEIEGFSVLMHMISYQSIGTSTLSSRACAGLTQGTLIFSIPGSPGACKDAWNGILKLQLDSRHKPCNLVELMPRFRER
jgi:molybdenum cofactor biosynthesis protein B